MLFSVFPVTSKTVSDCTIQNFQYLCKNQRCIPLDAVCNKKNDCGDGSDEGANCKYTMLYFNIFV